MIGWLLRRTRILRLQPGDVIVYRAYGQPSPQVIEKVTGQLRELFGDHECVVVAGGDLEVVRRDDDEAQALGFQRPGVGDRRAYPPLEAGMPVQGPENITDHVSNLPPAQR